MRRIAGRAMARRDMGKLVFLDVVDRSGRIQVICETAKTGEIDVLLGDVVGVAGVPGSARRGEPSLLAESRRGALAQHAAAAGHVPRAHRRRAPLPQALPRPADERGDARATSSFARRSSPRCGGTSTSEGFVEVETPVLQPRYGGAFARPFVTHHNELEPISTSASRPSCTSSGYRRRARARVRDRQGLPQRGRLVQAQPGVHDARVVRGLRRLSTTRWPGSRRSSRGWRSRCSARRRCSSAGTTSS